MRNWLEAFQILKIYLSGKIKKQKKVIFFDELPWISNPRSGFLEALGHFWNDWAGHNNVVMVICGSAAGWMVKNIVHHKGSLHNRITRLIYLKPFSLAETGAFFKAIKVDLSFYSMAQLCMVLGGIPQYLKEVRKGLSGAQNIDRICFSANGLLVDEFDKLYTSLYESPQSYLTVVRALSGKWAGLTRKQLLIATKRSDGGGGSRILSDLEQSDFITVIPPFEQKKKDAIYRLTDNYSLFYLKFMKGRRHLAGGTFLSLEKTSIWNSWCGYAFENVCLLHLPEIKAAMGIAGLYTEAGSFSQRGNTDPSGTQIDLIISRSDNMVNVCEVKFHNASFLITKKYASELQSKIEAIKKIVSPSKSVFLVMITCFGVTSNRYSLDWVHQNITLEELFS